MSAILTTNPVDRRPHPVPEAQTKIGLIAYLMRLRIRRVLFQVANWELFAAVALNRAVNKAAIVAIRVAVARNRAARGRYERRVARIH